MAGVDDDHARARLERRELHREGLAPDARHPAGVGDEGDDGGGRRADGVGRCDERERHGWVTSRAVESRSGGAAIAPGGSIRAVPS